MLLIPLIWAPCRACKLLVILRIVPHTWSLIVLCFSEVGVVIFYLFIFSFCIFFLVCSIPVDLGFLVDGSGSIEYQGKGNFGRMLNFIKSLVSFFEVSRGKSRVGLVLFSSRPIPIFGFKRYSSKAQLRRAIGMIRYPRGGTKIGRALDFTRSYLFKGLSVRRRKRVLLLLTDGISQDRVGPPAARMKATGVEVFAIGLGSKFRRRQLQQVATDQNHVLTVAFSRLMTLILRTKNQVCQKTSECNNSLLLSLHEDASLLELCSHIPMLSNWQPWQTCRFFQLAN